MDLYDVQCYKISKEEILTIFSLLNPAMLEKAEDPPLDINADASLKDFKADKESIKIFLRFMLGDNDLTDTFAATTVINKNSSRASKRATPTMRRKDSLSWL